MAAGCGASGCCWSWRSRRGRAARRPSCSVAKNAIMIQIPNRKDVSMKLLTSVLLFAAVASAQDTQANPLITVSKKIYDISKNDILKSVDKIPDEMWSYQPVKEVRTVAQLFAHVADAQYEFCGVAAEGKSVSKDIEKTLNRKTRAEGRRV